MNVKLELQQCPYKDTMERRNHEKVFEDRFFGGSYPVFFNHNVLLLCGRGTGKWKRNDSLYIVGCRTCDPVSGFYMRLSVLHQLPQKKAG